jgi:hypothetical protein
MVASLASGASTNRRGLRKSVVLNGLVLDGLLAEAFGATKSGEEHACGPQIGEP